MDDDCECDNECQEDKDEQKECEEPIYNEEEQIRVDINNHLISLFKNPDNYLNIPLNERLNIIILYKFGVAYFKWR